MRRAVAALAWLAAVVGTGATPVAAADLLIRDATVFDAVRARPYPTDVLVRDGRIAAIARGLEAPAQATVVEAKGLALLPGLFDVHTHWAPAMDPSSSALVSNAYLAAGVTTVNDFHQAPEAWQPRREWLSRLVAPRVRFAARMATPLGHGADWGDQATTKWVNSPDAARRAVRELLPYRPDLVKVFADGWRYGRMPDNTSMDPWTLAALVEEAHANQLKVVTHTVTVQHAKEAARAGVDALVHSVLDRRVDDELVELMSTHGMAYAPTLAVYEPIRIGERGQVVKRDDPVLVSRQRNFANALHNLRVLHRGGVMIALGTDSGMPGTPHGRATLHELELMVRAGLSPTEALRAGTINSARVLGVDADLGSIEVGKRADLILVEGAPWRDVRDMQRVRQVFLEGRPLHGGVALPAAIADSSGPNLQAWPEASPVTGAVVDDFERNDGRTALDTLRTGDADGGSDRSWQIQQVVPRAGGGHALRATAVLSSKPSPHADLVLPLSRGSVLPVAVGQWRGVEFEIRGEVASLGLQLHGLERRQWHAPLPEPVQEWRTVRVDFAQAQVSGRRGEPAADGQAWSGEPLLQLVLEARGAPGGTLWYEIDNVRFY